MQLRSKCAHAALMTSFVTWLVSGSPVVLKADEKDKAGEDIKKLVEDTKASVLGELKKVLQAEGDKFLAETAKILDRRSGERIAKLEEELKARDKKIAELEAKVKDLAGKPAPQPPAAPGAVAFLGVSHIEASPELLSRLKVESGAAVTMVIENSPAAAAGIQVNDVIVSVNGTAVTSASLSNLIAGLRPDQEVNLVYFHEANKVTKTTKLADREKFLPSAAKAQAPAKKEPVTLGVVAVERDKAIYIDSVEEGMTGSVAGLKKDDKLTHLNGKELKSLDDVVAELGKTLEGDKLKIVYVRGDETVTVEVIGSHGKDAKVLARNAQEKPKAPPDEKKEPEKKPGILGVSVVPDVSGVVVESVEVNTPAQVSGVEKGDGIKKLNGQDVNDVGQLKEMLAKLKAGDKVTILLARGDKTVELKDIALIAKGEKVAAGQKTEAKEAVKPVEKPKKPGRLGIVARETEDSKVIVKSVSEKGAAEKAGMKPEDVILKANDKAIRSLDDLSAVLQPLFAGDVVTLKVKRGEEEKDLKLTLGEPGAEEAANP